MERIEELLDDYRLAILSQDKDREYATRSAVLVEVAEGSSRRAGAMVQRGIAIGRTELQKELRALIGAAWEGDTPVATGAYRG